jgi:hypothetical protein
LSGRLTLHVGSRVCFEGSEQVVVSLDGVTAGLQAESGQIRKVLLEYLFESPGFALPGTESRIASDGLLASLRPEVVELAQLWERHVIEVETGRAPDSTGDSLPRSAYDPATTTLRQRDAAKASELTELGIPVSAMTVQRMRARYRTEGIAGLVDRRRSRPSRPYGAADNRVVEAVAECLGATFDVRAPRRADLFERVRSRLASRYGPDTVSMPSRATFSRLVRAVANSQQVSAAAATDAETALPAYSATRPGELVYLDSIALDLRASQGSGGSFPVVLTVAVDAATFCVAAAIVSSGHARNVDGAALLARMLVPESLRPGMRARKQFPATTAPSRRPLIWPDTLLCDRGSIHLSGPLHSACATLGISLRHTPPISPSNRASVERLLTQICNGFSRYVQGEAGAATVYGRQQTQDLPLHSIAELQDLLEVWIDTAWQVHPRESLRAVVPTGVVPSPVNAYAQLTATSGSVPVPLSGLECVSLLPAQWRAVHERGVTLHGQLYDSAELAPLRGAHSGVTSRDGQWEVRYDPLDLTQVWVRDHRNSGWLVAPWVGGAQEPYWPDVPPRHAGDRRVPEPAEDAGTVSEVLAILSPPPPGIRTGGGKTVPRYPAAPLTTREGWNTFVQSRSHAPAGDRDRQDTSAPAPLVVATPELLQVISHGRQLLALNSSAGSTRRGLVITGPASTGKTVALTELGRAFELDERRTLDASGGRTPVAYLATPPQATPRMMTVEIARFLGLPLSGRANLADLTCAVSDALRHVGCRLVLVDDFHHLFTSSPHAAPAVCAHLAYLSQQASATFAFAGIDLEHEGPFSAVGGAQVSGRFTVRRMSRFPYEGQEGQWHSLVAALEHDLHLRRHAPGTLVDLSAYLHQRTQGAIGSLRHLIDEAAAIAVDTGAEKITRTLLDGILLDFTAENAYAAATLYPHRQ